jgi:hypothetical protein
MFLVFDVYYYFAFHLPLKRRSSLIKKIHLSGTSVTDQLFIELPLLATKVPLRSILTLSAQMTLGYEFLLFTKLRISTTEVPRSSILEIEHQGGNSAYAIMASKSPTNASINFFQHLVGPSLSPNH